METLMEMCRQCHEHLRATDNKRDQILAFYAIVLSVAFGSLGGADDSNVYSYTFLWGVTLLGAVLILVLLWYAFWHVVYTNSARLIHRVALLNEQPVRVNSAEEWNSFVEREWNSIFGHGAVTSAAERITRTESLVFTAFVVLLLVPVYFLQDQQWRTSFR